MLNLTHITNLPGRADWSWKQVLLLGACGVAAGGLFALNLGVAVS
jgi:hypothetical protein